MVASDSAFINKLKTVKYEENVLSLSSELVLLVGVAHASLEVIPEHYIQKYEAWGGESYQCKISNFII